MPIGQLLLPGTCFGLLGRDLNVVPSGFSLEDLFSVSLQDHFEADCEAILTEEQNPNIELCLPRVRSRDKGDDNLRFNVGRFG